MIKETGPSTNLCIVQVRNILRFIYLILKMENVTRAEFKSSITARAVYCLKTHLLGLAYNDNYISLAVVIIVLTQFYCRESGLMASDHVVIVDAVAYSASYVSGRLTVKVAAQKPRLPRPWSEPRPHANVL